MKRIYLSENAAVRLIKIVLVIAVLMVPLGLIDASAKTQAQENQLVYSLPIAAWHETTFAGIPFLLDCQKENVDQWFELKVKQNGNYLPVLGKGFLQAYNIVWISFPDDFKLPAKSVATLELYTSGPDKIGIKSVSLIADHAFEWLGDEPINPPEE